MAEATSKTPTSKKKGKQLKNPQKTGLAIGGAVLVYVLYRWYQNRSSTSTSTTAAGATDPLTGQPYAAGVGSLAAGTDQGSAITDPLTGDTAGSAADIAALQAQYGGSSAIDPATGQTYASEIATDTQNAGIDPATGQTYASEITSAGIDPLTGNTYVSELPGGTNYVSPAGSNPSTPTGGTSFESRDALIADVAKATGLSTDAAGQQVALYLEGKPLTNAGAVNSIRNQIQAGLAQTTNGSTTLPLPVLAKGVTQQAPATAPVKAPAKTPVAAKK